MPPTSPSLRISPPSVQLDFPPKSAFQHLLSFEKAARLLLSILFRLEAKEGDKRKELLRGPVRPAGDLRIHVLRWWREIY